MPPSSHDRDISQPDSRGAARERRWAPLLTVVSVAYVMIMFGWVLDDGGAHRRHVVGACIALPALALWTTARLQLGASFTARVEARRLVTHGLYARLRHPIYLFGEITVIGVLVFIGGWWLLPISLVTIPLQIWRARREARTLAAAFGDDYRAWRARTWF